MFRHATTRQINFGLALLRGVIGAIFIAHGAQKIFVFGFAGVIGAFGQMGVPMPGVIGPLVALVEFLGGMALVAGLLTRLASLGLLLTMVGAIATVHIKAGFFLPNGYEYPLALLGSTGLLTLAGAGAFSLDALIRGRLERNQRSETRPLDARRAA